MKKTLLFLAALFCRMQGAVILAAPMPDEGNSTVTPDGIVATVTVTEVGTLQSQVEGLNASHIKSLTVKGVMGGQDLDYVTSSAVPFTHLETLDLSEATLVANGYSYYGVRKSSGVPGIADRYLYYYLSPQDNDYEIHPYSSTANHYVRTDMAFAFKQAMSINSLKLPKGMRGMGEQCFSGCSGLSAVVATDEILFADRSAFNNTGVQLTTQDGVVYWKNIALYYDESYFANANTPVKIKEGTTVIADGFMNGNANAGALTLPSTLKTIGKNAFYNCSGLTLSSLPANIQYIRENAFNGCTALAEQSINVPSSIVEIGEKALTAFKSVTLAGTDNLWFVSYNSMQACTNTETVDGVTYINDIAWKSGTTTKEPLWLRDGTRLVGAYACSDIAGCTRIHVPKTVKRINKMGLFNEYTASNLLYPAKVTDVYIHCDTPPVLDERWQGNYKVTVHLRKSAETAYENIKFGPWYDSNDDDIVYDLEEVEFGGDVNGAGGGTGIANTPATAYSVAKAKELIAAGVGLDAEVYTKGFITAIDAVNVGTYGNATYYINDTKGSTGGQLCVWRGYYLDGAKFTATDQIGVGDEVIVKGKLINYNGTYEIATGNHIHSITKAEKDPNAVNIANTPETAYSVAKAHQLIAAGKGLETSVYVVGSITNIKEVSPSYGNATYTIQDAGDPASLSLVIYRGKYLNNTKFTAEDQIKLGDRVVVFGKLIDYNGTYEMASGNYIYSINEEAGIHDIVADPKKQVIYNISGQRLTAPKKGINIIDGKKVVIK